MNLLQPAARFDRFEEGLEVITRLFKSDEPVSYDGRYFQFRGATLLPTTHAACGGLELPLAEMGRNAHLPYVVRYADEWNAVYLPAPEIEIPERPIGHAAGLCRSIA